MPTDDINLSGFLTDAPMPPYTGAGDWPLLSDWTAVGYGGAVCLEGRVTGHPRLSDGGVIRTSALSRIARDRSWAQTRNTVYALGTPAKQQALPEHIPDILQLVSSPDWDAAVALLMAWTKPRAPLTPLRCREAILELAHLKGHCRRFAAGQPNAMRVRKYVLMVTWSSD